MAIQEQLQRLFELSQVDAEIANIRVKILDAPKRSDELTLQLQATEGQISEKTNRLSGIQKEKSGLESELQFSKDCLASFESKANQIKTNKEYQAAIKEIAETKNAQKQMEDRLAKLNTEGEEIQKELNQLSQTYQTDKQTAEEERNKLEALELQVSQETRDLDEKRKTTLESLEPALKGKYERIRTSRQTAVTTVLQGTCQACNMKIAPQLLIEVQKFTSIHSCPSCHRILYIIGGSS